MFLGKLEEGKKGMVTLKMPTSRDLELVQYLLQSSTSGAVRWEPTAEEDEYSASVKGKYKVLVGKLKGSGCWMTLKDARDQELVTVWEGEYSPVGDLFERARRSSLNVDGALDEILGSKSQKQ